MRNRILFVTGAMVAVAADWDRRTSASREARRNRPCRERLMAIPISPDVRFGDADAARAASGPACGSVGRGSGRIGEEHRRSREPGETGRSRGDRSAPPKGGDGSVGPAGNVGGYNTFWLDRGTRYSTVDGQKRSSIVIDPADGKVPPLTPGGASAYAEIHLGPADFRCSGKQPRPRPRAIRLLRRSRTPPARRAMPARIRIDVWPAGAAELLLQQPAPDRADAPTRS